MNYKIVCLTILLFLLTVSISHPIAYAGSPNIEEFDDYLAERLGTTQFIGGLIATIIFFMFIVFPITFISRKSGALGFFPEIAASILVLVLGVSLGWVHYWVLLMLGLITVGLFSGKIRDWLGGGK